VLVVAEFSLRYRLWRWREPTMPVFMIEREYAEEFELDPDRARLVDETTESLDIRWITSFLSADKKKSYCLYEAESAEILRTHAAELGLPLNAITQVDELVR
jgi:Nickel responsive protein SCO4226-like